MVDIEKCPICGEEEFTELEEFDSILGRDYSAWHCNNCEYEEHVDDNGDIFTVELKPVHRGEEKAEWNIGQDMLSLICPKCGKFEIEIGDEIGGGDYWDRSYEIDCNECGWQGIVNTQTVCSSIESK